MQITEPAAKIILQTMIAQGLDPNKTSIFFDVRDQGLIFEFTLENKGKEINFHGLRVQCGNPVNMIIDYTEVQGKRGLVFLNDENK